MVRVRICCGLECSARGGQELISAIEEDPVLRPLIELCYDQCLSACQNADVAPVVSVNGKNYTSMTAEKLVALLYALLGTTASVAQ